jgi:hypothetical protein
MQRPRTPSKLSESLHQRLNSYALAASAAGVGMLALTQPLEAKIVYTKAHQQIAPNTQFNLDLNHDGITDFTIANRYFFTNSKTRGGSLKVTFPTGNAVRGYVNSTGFYGRSYFLASAFRAGVQIKANNKKFLPKYATMGFSFTATSGFFHQGQWRNATNRYLGLKFAIQGQIHYGWARLTTNCSNYQCNALLTGYAYETIPGKSIVTGKTHGKDVVTVEPATLGHLARGASGLSAWRRTNSVAASH